MEAPIKEIRILGVQVDSRLKWGPHIRAATEKGKAQLKALQRISAATWGTTFAKTRLLYTAVIWPTLTYGCKTWAQGEKGKPPPKTLLAPLQKVQNQCLRVISGAYKRTSIRLLEKETHVPPLPIYIQALNMAQTLKDQDSPLAQVLQGMRQKLRQATRAQRGRPRPTHPSPEEVLYGQATQVKIEADSYTEATFQKHYARFLEKQQHLPLIRQ